VSPQSPVQTPSPQQLSSADQHKRLSVTCDEFDVDQTIEHRDRVPLCVLLHATEQLPRLFSGFAFECGRTGATD
jgi:hypothetical protein